MEDGFGTIIYLIITFLIIIASLFKKKKKSAQVAPAGTSQEEGSFEEPSGGLNTGMEKGMESLLTSVLGVQAASVEDSLISDGEFSEDFEDEAPKKQEPARVNEGVTVFAKDDPATERIETGLHDSLATKGMETIEVSDLKDRKTELESMVEEFDIKKAVVYSEILRPKHF